MKVKEGACLGLAEGLDATGPVDGAIEGAAIAEEDSVGIVGGLGGLEGELDGIDGFLEGLAGSVLGEREE